MENNTNPANLATAQKMVARMVAAMPQTELTATVGTMMRAKCSLETMRSVLKLLPQMVAKKGGL